MFCFFSGRTFLANRAFAVAIVLHQGDFAWADVRAGATFDTVKQVMLFCFVELLCLTEPVELLWQQICRACISAHTAADTGHGHIVGRQFFLSWSKQTVCRFHDRKFSGRQCEAHHRPAHNNTLTLLSSIAAQVKKMADGCTEQYFPVAFIPNCIASNSGDTAYQW